MGKESVIILNDEPLKEYEKRMEKGKKRRDLLENKKWEARELIHGIKIIKKNNEETETGRKRNEKTQEKK